MDKIWNTYNFDALERLEENATYHGDEAEDWCPEGDADRIRQALSILERLMGEPIEKIDSWDYTLSDRDKDFFVAMRDQLIKEAKDETTN